MRLKLFLLFLLSVLPSPSSQAPDPTFAVFQLLDEDFVHNRNKIALQTPPKKIQKYHKNAQSSSAQKAASYNQNVIDISQRDFDLNEVDVDTRALNILDKINAQEADEFGRKCVNKTMMRRETEYEEVMTCEHSYDERCHTSYTTTYEPHQEEECEERFRKVCMIWSEQKAVTEMVEECTTPLVPDCATEAEDVCRTVYDTVCDTKKVGYEVEEQFPNCSTVNMEKCGDVTTGLLTEKKCVLWPTQQCSVETRNVTHNNYETECRKEPRELCAPGDCPLVEGPPVCQEKMKTVVVDHPVEQCDLEPSQTCKQVTKLIPSLNPTQECVQVPKEVCAMSRVNPKIIHVPFIQRWCFNPNEVDLPQIAQDCPQSFAKFRNHCYKVEGTNKSWKEAHEHCVKELQADLASIHSADEDNFVHNLIASSRGESVWLGLEEHGNDSFEWTDGTTYDYSNWDPAVPNPSMECGAKLSDTSKWVKHLCSDQKKFVCKRNLFQQV